jgi:hypothetical protein
VRVCVFACVCTCVYVCVYVCVCTFVQSEKTIMGAHELCSQHKRHVRERCDRACCQAASARQMDNRWCQGNHGESRRAAAAPHVYTVARQRPRMWNKGAPSSPGGRPSSRVAWSAGEGPARMA